MAERKVLLVCWQGAEQKEIDHLLKEGKLPQLQRAIDEGSNGNLFGFPPRDPTIDWATLTTGVCPHDHGVLSPAFFDSNLKKAVPAPNSIRKFPAFWNLLSQQSLATHVIGGPLSYPAEQISGIYLSQKLIDDLQTRTINAEICEDLILPVEWNEHLQDLKVTADSLDPRLLEFFLTSSEEIPKSRDFRWKTIVYRLSELYTAHNFAIHLLHS